MKISEYLKEENIIMDMKAATKEDAIRELGESLRGEKGILDFEAFMQAVSEREKLTSTGIGDQVAIPHARTNRVEDVVIALGRSMKGVEFESIDKQPANLILLIGTPEKRKLSAYMKLLAHLSRLLKKSDFRQRLLSASTAAEILNEFKKVEE